MPLKSLPEEARPRERLELLGVDALSPVELIALILGSGSQSHSVLQLAERVLAHFGSLKKIAQSSMGELTSLPGIGKAKATALIAALALGRRAEEAFLPNKMISTPDDAYHYVKELGGYKREHLKLLLRDVHGRLIQSVLIGEGTIDQVLVHPMEIFHEAFLHRAKRVILAHNHPSGRTTPSDADLKLTYRLIECGNLLDVHLDDHLIIGEGSYFSLWQQGFFTKMRSAY